MPRTAVRRRSIIATRRASDSPVRSFEKLGARIEARRGMLTYAQVADELTARGDEPVKDSTVHAWAKGVLPRTHFAALAAWLCTDEDELRASIEQERYERRLEKERQRDSVEVAALTRKVEGLELQLAQVLERLRHLNG